MNKLLLTVTYLFVLFIGYAQCPIVYVTPAGTAGGAGTQASPKSISAAFSSATAGTVIRIATGIYELDAPLTIPANNIVVEGGFIANSDWTKTSVAGATTLYRTTVNPEGDENRQRLVALQAINKTGFEVHDVTIQTANADLPGMSTYAVYLSGCGSYRFMRCLIEAGNAADGMSGGPGEAGANGVAGSNGSAGSCDGGTCTFSSGQPGGAGGAGGLGAVGINGGAGGPAQNNAQNPGSNGTAATGRNGGGGGGGGAGGDECTVNNGGNGGAGGASACFAGGGGGNRGSDGDPGTAGANGNAGTNGSTGTQGAPGTEGGEVDGFWVAGGQGENGGDGCGGAGGGGGGGGGRQVCTFCDNGPGNGGGGGGGGQGGTGASGGFGGGASFGVYANANGAAASFIDCKITAGTPGFGGQGGQGGQGGLGGNGGAGNTTCSSEIGVGGNGGKGGNGGNGGNGGSGANGVAANVQLASGENYTVLSTNFNLATQPEIRLSYAPCFGPTVVVQNMTIAEGDSVTTWTFGASAAPTSGTNNPQSVAYSTSGFFNVVNGTNNYRGFAYYCCGETAAIEESNIQVINVYPNPNNGLFSIDFGKTYDRVNVEVYDAAGKQIVVKEFNHVEKAQLSIDEPAGVYYIHLIIGEGKHVLPFIKQ